MAEQIKVEVPKQIIEEQIHKGLLEAVGSKKDALVTELVDRAMSFKQNSYDRETVLQAAFKKAVQDAAKEAMIELVEEAKPQIRKAILRKLRESPEEFADRLADVVMNGLASSFYVSANMKIDD